MMPLASNAQVPTRKQKVDEAIYRVVAIAAAVLILAGVVVA